MQLQRGLGNVPFRRVEVFMPQYLRESDQIARIVGKVLVGHRVPEQMWMNVEPTNHAVFVAQCPHTFVRQWPSFADEHGIIGDWWPTLQISAQYLSSHCRNWD